MKRKKTLAAPQQAPVAPVAQPFAAQGQGQTIDMVMSSLFAGLLLLSMTIQTGRMSMILLVLAFVLSIGKTPLRNLRDRFGVPLLGFLAFAFMQGFAAIYSHFGSYAVSEYQKYLAGFALGAILLFRFGKRHVRGLLWGITAVCAFISLICVDLGSWGVLFSGFNSITELLGASFVDVVEMSEGIRVNGIYNDANITGAILGPALLLSWHLAHTEETRWKQASACVLVGMNAMGFLIAMSRGAILCVCLAALVYLAAERKNRLSLFFLMLSTVVALAPTGGLAMLHMNAGELLPVLLMPVCGALIFLLEWAVGARLARKCTGHGWIVTGVCGAVLALAVGLSLVAWNQDQEPYTFTNEENVLYRAFPMEVGAYTLTGDWDGGSDTTVFIYSRTREEALMERHTTLYEGPLSDASFTVPDESVRVYFQIRSSVGNTIRSVTLSDGTMLPLVYKWLPEMIAYRLQDGMFQSYSFLLRAQFMKDGWTLFTQSPLIGHGLGSSEGLLTSVQPFYYESKYLHNHVLQVMEDMGLLGLTAFLALLLGDVWLLLRRLRKEKDALAAALLACWVMLNAHSLMEINFSVRAFQCLAYTLLALPIVLYAEPEGETAMTKGRRWAGCAVACLFWVYLAVFGGLYESHRMVVRSAGDFATSDANEFMSTIQGYVGRDVFDHEDIQLTYVANAAQLNDSRYNGYLRKYVEELRASGTYTACSGLARYYYLPRGEYAELFACSREGIAQEASNKDAWNLQLDFYRTEVLPAMGEEHLEVFLDGVQALRDQLTTFSEGRLEEIVLSPENQAFLAAADAARSAASPEEAMAYLLPLMGKAE